MAILLLLVLQLAGGPDPVASLSLEVDGERFGEFANLEQDKNAPTVVELKQGWIETGFLRLWWPDFDVAELVAGQHSFENRPCAQQRVDVRQALALGRPGRERAWALMGACPISLHIREASGESGRLVVETLKMRVTGVAAAM